MTNHLVVRLNFFEKNRLAADYEKGERHFHILKDSRDKYRFDKNIYTLCGNVIFPDYRSVREFAHKMNEKRDLIHNPKLAVKAGHLNAMALIDEVLHHILRLYRTQVKPTILKDALSYLGTHLGSSEEVESSIREFMAQFPPVNVYQGKQTADEYITQDNEGVSNREIELEEMLMLWIANENPAFSHYTELFDDSKLKKKAPYLEVISGLRNFFETQPKFGADNMNLIDLLRAPALAHPDSLVDQLKFMKETWKMELLSEYYIRMLTGADIIREEEKMNFPVESRGEVITMESLSPSDGYEGMTNSGPGTGGSDPEYENFTPDRNWMPRVIMIAKNAFVWLDQLSKQYAKSITKLNEIPDDELKRLGKWGFTSLWLIGLWERSRASKIIKRSCGNPEAEASAYSLYDYVISADLGGEPALADLKQRAFKYGIRLASDMVPNHMSIDSKWVSEHPDWFVQLDYQPFPTYSYNGPNLSCDPNVGIYVEDHYYSKSDAAVVFKRVDFNRGDTRYVYHGNDGTNMPWNDTAQLNYLNHEVREAVIQTILHLARSFQVIRFDAAMTLAKRHYQRLWFPEPGTGGDIPSRSEHGMTKDQFNEVMPQEFWREVVDRIAAEQPDTLLLAEAFWLMEGYFVRTLGMHRVYNSAFMNFMKKEENAKYRLSIRNVLEFDPEILQRFVNFQNNPDEKTAVEQFGKGDKYFGVCITMITMPGLPMFGHGQVEGFTEKYGMEYRKAYWNESVDHELVRRHEKEVFPIMQKRALFAGVENFLLYDFHMHDGSVNENVLAYSNRMDNEKALVIYNNKFESTSGWISMSVGYLEKSSREIIQRPLSFGLTIPFAKGFTLFKDQISGLEYIRDNEKLHKEGLFVEIGPYKYSVFLDFKHVKDTPETPYAQLYKKIEGRGVESMEDELNEIINEKLLTAFRKIANRDVFAQLVAQRKAILAGTAEKKKLKLYKELGADYEKFMAELIKPVDKKAKAKTGAGEIFANNIEAVVNLPALKLSALDAEADKYLQSNVSGDLYYYYIILGWAVCSGVGLDNIEKYRLGKVIVKLFTALGMADSRAIQQIRHMSAFIRYQLWWEENKTAHELMKALIDDPNTQKVLQLNKYQGVTWFNKEAFENFIGGLFVVAAVEIYNSGMAEVKSAKAIKSAYLTIMTLLDAKEKSGYSAEKLMDLLVTAKPVTAKPVAVKPVAVKLEKAKPAVKKAVKKQPAIKKKTTEKLKK